MLTIRHAKYGHARLIPAHSSALEALQRYRTLRDKATGLRVCPPFLVTVRGKPLGYTVCSAASE